MKLYPLFILLILNLTLEASSEENTYTDCQSQYYGSDSESDDVKLRLDKRKTDKETLKKQILQRSKTIKYLDYSGLSFMAFGISLKWIGKIDMLDSMSKTMLTLVSEGFTDLSLGVQIIKCYLETKKSTEERILNTISSEV